MQIHSILKRTRRPFSFLSLSFSLSFYLFPLQSNHRNMICSDYWLILIPLRCLLQKSSREHWTVVACVWRNHVNFALGKNRRVNLHASTREIQFQTAVCFALNTRLNLTNDICICIYIRTPITNHPQYRPIVMIANYLSARAALAL